VHAERKRPGHWLGVSAVIFSSVLPGCWLSNRNGILLTTKIPNSTNPGIFPGLLNQGFYKSSLTNFQEISRKHFFKSRRFLRDKMQVKFVMSVNEHVMMSSDQPSSLCHQSLILFTGGLPYVQCNKNAWRAKTALRIIKFSRSIN